MKFSSHVETEYMMSILRRGSISRGKRLLISSRPSVRVYAQYKETCCCFPTARTVTWRRHSDTLYVLSLSHYWF